MKFKRSVFHFIFNWVLIGIATGKISACTIIAVDKSGTADGSMINTNASDSRTTRTWLDMVPHRKHPSGATCPVFQNSKRTVSAGDLSAAKVIGEIPQLPETFGYLNTGYPCMNEHQVSVTESTFGGRDTLRNKNAMFACEELCRMIMERAKTAREAIRTIDDLTLKYGYNEGGEVLVIADKTEIWLLEIIGCGHDQIGAVWAARRVPAGHVTVNANGSRLLGLNLADSANFLASKNVFEVAQKYGWWSPESGEPFRFAYIYGPESRRSMAARRREWRVFDLVAPSLNLDPNASDFPFSVKPDTLVSVEQIMSILRDTFEGTDFDMTKNITTVDNDGKCVKSPYANPFMDYDMMPLFKINGGWGKMGERAIARYFCNYTVICQSRAWLPDAIGGVVWHGFDNPATTIQAPVYVGVTRLPASYKISGRAGYRHDCAWWAFNRVADLAAQRWGDMRVDVDSARAPLQAALFQEKAEVEQAAVKLYAQKPARAIQRLTEFTNEKCEMIVARWWKLGDELWSKYTGKF